MANDPKTPLYKALAITQADRWRGMRSEMHNSRQVRECIDFLHSKGIRSFDGVTKEHIRQLKDYLRKRGLSAGTINRKLALLSAVRSEAVREGLAKEHAVAIGSVRGVRLRRWYLTPEAADKLLADLDKHMRPMDAHMAWFIRWTIHTGLRVEETLRVRRGDFIGLDGDKPILNVRGTKSARAIRTIAIGPTAQALASEAFKRPLPAHTDDLLCDRPYKQLQLGWDRCRKFLGEEGNPTCTLKALRRTFAAYATLQNGMPMSVLKDHFGHSDLKTTLGYLTLMGGAHVEASRQWLK